MTHRPTYEELVERVRELEARVEAQAAIQATFQENEERFELAMRNACGGYFDWNLVTEEIFFSPGWKRLLGYEDEEIENVFSAWERLTHPEDVKASWAMLEELLARKIDRFEIEFRMKHREGRWVDILSRANVVFDEAGKAIRVVGSHTDITEKKASEQRLKESEKLFRAVFEQAGGYCMILEPHESGIPRVLDANTAACETHGFTRDEMIGRAVSDLDDEEGKRLCIERTREILTGRPFSIQTDHLRKDGTSFPVSVYANLVRFADRPPLIVTTEHDISDIRAAEAERMALEKKVQQAQKLEAIGVLAGGIAHDFNNLIAVISGNASLLLSSLEEGEEGLGIEQVRLVLLEVLEGARQATELTGQLLTFAKGGAPVRRVADLNRLLKESARFVMRGRSIGCDFDLSPELVPVEVDSGQINQTVNNLVLNALEVLPEGGRLTIRTRKEELAQDNEAGLPAGVYARIEVEDDGPGIPESVMTKIFDPYFTTKETGSGLGLATTRSIVTRHGGQISVRSVVGEGTTFTILLPGSSQELVEEEEDTRPGHTCPRGPGRILVMDDQEQLRKLAARILTHLGFEVSLAPDGSTAIELFRAARESSDPFLLVILDMTLPGGMSGAQVLAELRELDPQVRAVVSSGYSSEADLSRYQELGFAESLPKPYTSRQVRAMLGRLLGEGGPSGQGRS